MSLKAIAAALGLSVTTVSRALNGYEDVAQETRQRVVEEAQRRGYRPNASARRLKTGRANAVGLVYPVSALPMSSDQFSDMLLALDHSLSRHEIDLLLFADKPQEYQRTLTHMLRSRSVDAVIVTHTTPQDPRLLLLQQKGFSFLAMGRSDLAQNYAWFDIDNYAGSQLAVNYCLKNSLQQIAWLGGNEACTFVRDRRQGYLDALGQIPPFAIAAVKPSRRAGYQQTCAWLAEGRLPQAMITDCGPLAEGAAMALQQAGRLQGKNAVTLIAWDGLPRDAILDQPIITVCQATQHAVGEKVAEMILSMLDGAPLAQLQTLWQPWLSTPVGT
ncbi:LacI family DNA-binding transcriptional regulator [Mixta mediterraneensis]|uniref:LacI family DNA-binding transcriptional regulator n=1 Tax=Mixta mediterraneensis TaxID=2758443 RepID=UPI001876E487|nr:LacI family DNA-binding transcriptional regulator [Mixta mediterraneensis]MBE5254349.1 LacI family DNA-binding transcriptional regulator [Mixta mediterraneensis]